MSAQRNGYAYFAITTALPLKDIENYMGMTGEGQCWSNGDPTERPDGSHYRFSNWKLGSGVERDRPLNEHLEALWRRLSDHRAKIVGLPKPMSGRISCVGHFQSHRDQIPIAAGHFSTAAYYRISLDFDFYFDDNFGHEEEGAPYWLW